MKKLTLISLLTILIISQTSIWAYGSNEEKKENKDQIKIERKIEKKEIEQKNNDDNEDDDKDKNKKEFKLKGEITAATSSSFTILDKTIKIDSQKTKEFKQIGEIKVGNYAMIEGIIDNNILYATKIIVNNRNDNAKKNDRTIFFKVDEDDDITPTLTPTISPSVTPSTTPSASPIPTGTLELKIEKSTLAELISSLEKLLNLLKGISKE